MKTKIWVRHENLNGNELVLQRKKRYFFFFTGWVRWKLFQANLYKIEAKLEKLAKDAEKLFAERDAELEYLAREKKSVSNATRQTFGLGRPFQLTVNSKELKECERTWPKQPEGHWRKVFAPNLFRGKVEGIRQGAREKTGSVAGEQVGTRSAYIHPEFKAVISDIREQGDYDNAIEYRENKDNQQGKRRNRGNNQNQQNNGNNGNNNRNNDDNY